MHHTVLKSKDLLTISERDEGSLRWFLVACTSQTAMKLLSYLDLIFALKRDLAFRYGLRESLTIVAEEGLVGFSAH